MGMFCLVVFLLVKATACTALSESRTSKVILTESGPVRGSTLLAYGQKQVEAFLGIPFARPPLGPLRFRAPQPVEPWTNVFNANAFSKSCPQKSIPFSRVLPPLIRWTPRTDNNEDCLALNIWKPINNDTGLTDILVFIHGGGFTHGSTSVEVYDGAVLSAATDMLVVSFNYRVGSLGFLFLDHLDAPGNMGLMDQRLAIEWIKANARSFGGDPDRITLWGQSAGAVSIVQHMMSPGSQGLFNRAFLLSGASTSRWSYGEKDEIQNLSVNLLKESGCYRKRNDSQVDHELSMDCLRELSFDDVIGNEPNNGYDDIFVFKPVVDGIFIPNTPRKLLEAGAFQKVDTLFGLVKEEGGLFLPGQLPQYFGVRKGTTPRLSSKVFRECAETICLETDRSIIDAIVMQYNNFEEPDNDILNARKVMEMMGDSYFTCTLNEMAEFVTAAGSSVYKYLFDHRSSNSLWPEWMGATHTDDIPFFFGEPLKKRQSYTDDETTLSLHMVKSLAAFARYGNPNYEGSTGRHWPKHTTVGKEYLIFSAGNLTVGKRYQERNCYFWNTYLPTLKKALAKSN